MGLCVAAFATAAPAAESFAVRLAPGPRLVGTRADRSGSGTVNVTLDGRTLTLEGSYDGLLGTPTAATLFAGPAPGVRGPKIADLTVTAATTGEVSGKVTLNSKQLTTFHKGGLYIEIDSGDAPDGDLWGWLMPAAE